MCKAVELANVINNAIEEAKACKNQLEIKLKVYENLQQDILHKIECENISDKDSYDIMSSLHEIRVERRKIKDELKTFSVLDTLIGDFKINIKDVVDEYELVKKLTKNKVYLPRAIDLKNINLDYIKEVIKFINTHAKSKTYIQEAIMKNNIKKDKIIKKNYCSREKLYKVTIDKIPKEVGSSINVCIADDYGHYVNRNNIKQLVPCYESYELHEDEGYIRLINRLSASQRKNRQK